MRVTKQQKRRIQREARKAGLSVSAYLLQGVGGEVTPQKPESGEVVISIGGASVEEHSRPEVKAKVSIKLTDEAFRLAE